jgi:hypothetical protein
MNMNYFQKPREDIIDELIDLYMTVKVRSNEEVSFIFS